MNRLTKIFLVLAPLFLFSKCGDYLDINTDPYRAKTVSLDGLLPANIESTSYNHYLVAFTTGLFAQHLASYTAGGSDAYQETRMATAWTGLYLTALTNIDVMVKQAVAEQSPHYAGIGKVLQVINLGMATDTWGDVPYSGAFKGAEDFTAPFDDQAAIYTTINTLLDDAIVQLQQPISYFKPASDDLAYAGKLANWIKLAYALKARYAIHLTGKNANTAATNALAAVPLVISSNADDFQLIYSTTSRNPWFNNVSSPIESGNFTVGPSEQLINLMNGTYYTVLDPRLPKMFDNRGASTYSGLVNGQGTGGNSRLSISTWYGAQTAPLLMVTFAEMKFIEAEARLRLNDPVPAYNAYLAGIRAHMEKLGVLTADINSYINHANVSVGSANLTLELIMKEKYIATYLNPEAWVDVRRFDYKNTTYRGMDKPFGYNTALEGEFIRRVLYPNEEINRNRAEATPHIQPMQAKMWWEN